MEHCPVNASHRVFISNETRAKGEAGTKYLGLEVRKGAQGPTMLRKLLYIWVVSLSVDLQINPFRPSLL
jgi:hypothetical protein